MKFWKYEGIGNDFIIIDGFSNPVEVDKNLCKMMCDRHFGVGADGVLYILPGNNNSDIVMRIINADGSEAEMCGNGIRCVAKHAFDFGMVEKKKFTIGTVKRNITSEVLLDDFGKVKNVMVDMGSPILNREEVPVNFYKNMISEPIDVGGITITGTAVSMGNPHFVTFDKLDNEVIDRLGPLLECHSIFPQKANIEFAEIKDGKIYVRVYERGAGWTLACGTGACATATAAALNKLVPFNKPVCVCLPGGWLEVIVDKDLKYVMMSGPSKYVYCGDYTGEIIQ